MATRVEAAITGGAAVDDVAKAAVKDAIDAAPTEEAKKDLALELYKEATGRFPQESSDRRIVFLGGFVLVGVVFVVLAVVAVILVSDDKSVPDSLSTLATALVSGMLGGLLGYAQQK